MISMGRYALAVLSGLLLALAYAPFSISLTAWFALIPLLLSVAGGTGNSFLQGLLAGVVFRALSMYWIAGMLHTYAQASWAVSVGAFALLITILSCYTGIFVWAFRKVTDRWGARGALLAPFFWVALEYANAHMTTGFHWNFLSVSQAHHLKLVQFAEFTQAYGVSGLVVLVNTALYLLIAVRLKWSLRGASRRFALLTTLLTALLVVSVSVWGAWRMEAVEAESAKGTELRVRLVNPAVPQDVKWSLEFQRKALEDLAVLSRQGDGKPDLIVWPEAAVPFYFEENPYGAKVVYDLSKELGVPILFGAPGQRTEGNRAEFTNSAYLVNPDGGVVARYDKQRLVPFGEYVPLRPLLPFIPAVAQGLARSDLSPGRDITPFPLHEARLALLICYEAIFPSLVDKALGKGANVLVNLSNDAWVGRAGAHQHFAMVKLRAIEARVPMLRLANWGTSGMIAPNGQLTCRLPVVSAASRDCEISLPTTSRAANWPRSAFAITCLIFSVVILWTCLFVGRRHP